jgi:hypothetical protein
MLVYEMDVLHFAGGADGQAFQIAASRLQHLRDVYSVDTIWVMPPYERLASAPYATNNFYSIDPRLGSKEDAKVFVTKAHDLGMKVLFDITTIGHGCGGGASPSGVNPKDRPLVLPQRFPTMPDLCYYKYCTELNQMIEFYSSIFQYWVQDVGIDGYRCDSANLNEFYSGCIQSADFWAPVIANTRSMTARPLYFFAENTDIRMADTWIKPSGFNGAIGSMVGECYPGEDLSLVNAVRHGAYAPLEERLKAFAREQTESFNYMTRIVNHDIWAYGVPELGRAANPLQLFGGTNGVIRAWLLSVFGSTGTVLIYNGQEYGHTRPRQEFNNVQDSWNLDFSARTPAIDLFHQFTAQLFNQYASLFRSGGMEFCSVSDSFAIVRSLGALRIGLFLGSACKSHFGTLDRSMLTGAVEPYSDGIDIRSTSNVASTSDVATYSAEHGIIMV